MAMRKHIYSLLQFKLFFYLFLSIFVAIDWWIKVPYVYYTQFKLRFGQILYTKGWKL